MFSVCYANKKYPVYFFTSKFPQTLSMERHVLKSFLEKNNLDIDNLCYLIEQGIEMERLNLEVTRSMKGDSVSVYSKLMEGERFLSLLTSVRAT